MKDLFEDGHVDVAISQPTYLREWYTEGFNTTERNGELVEKHPGKFRSTPVSTREATPACASSRPTSDVAAHGRSCTRRSGTATPAARSSPTPRPTGSSSAARNSASRTSTSTRARRSGRSTRTRSTSPTSTRSPPSSRAQLHRRARGPAPHRGLLLHGDAGAQRLRRPVRGPRRLMHARPRYFAKVMGELLFWVGENRMTFGCDYAIWEPRWQVEGFVDWDYPEGHDSPTTRASASTARRRSSA